jgi:hypothetical protein
MSEVQNPTADANVPADATDTNATLTLTTEATKVPRGPSKKSQALAIFDRHLETFKAGGFASNRDFRAAVIDEVKATLGVSTASAATMYNAAKVAAEAGDTDVRLGRDPKKVVIKTTTGRRGRPKKTVAVDVSAVETPETAPAGEAEVAAQPEPATV